VTLVEFATSANAWTFALTCLVGLVQCLVLWALWSIRKVFVTSKTCEDCRKACRGQVDERLAKQESASGSLHDKVGQAAQKDELAKAATADEALRGDIKALTATIEGLKDQQRRLERQVGLLMEHHLGGSR
jgi:hypothetical protein